MAGEYDGTDPIKSLGGDLVPQGWDRTITNPATGTQGYWRVLEPSDLAGFAPLGAPTSNIARTALSYPGSAVAVAAGACVYGFLLANDPDSADRLYYGTLGVTSVLGDVLEPGERIWLPVTDSGSVYVLPAAAGVYYRGVRY